MTFKMAGRFSISPSEQTSQTIDEILETTGGSKSDIVNLIVERYLTVLKENELLKELLDSEKKTSLGILRSIEQRLNVLYEVENTRQNYEAFPELRPTIKEKAKIIVEAEEQVELERKNNVFNYYEKLRSDTR